jgi:hypothetical protein
MANEDVLRIRGVADHRARDGLHARGSGDRHAQAHEPPPKGTAAMKTVIIDYTNWRGERRNRRIRPTGLAFASNEYHTKPVWMVLARDLDTNEDRTFALENIHRWEEGNQNV